MRVLLLNEPTHIQALYGLNHPFTTGFGCQGLLAQSLTERGVRYTITDIGGHILHSMIR